MKHFYDTTFQLRNGLTIPAPGVSVTVYLQGTLTLATIYSDDGITATSNPLTSNANGRFDFYVANGRYDLAFSGPGVNSFTQLNVEITDAMDTTSLGKTPIAFTAANTHSGNETFTGNLSIGPLTLPVNGPSVWSVPAISPATINSVSGSSGLNWTANCNVPLCGLGNFNGSIINIGNGPNSFPNGCAGPNLVTGVSGNTASFTIQTVGNTCPNGTGPWASVFGTLNNCITITNAIAAPGQNFTVFCDNDGHTSFNANNASNTMQLNLDPGNRLAGLVNIQGATTASLYIAPTQNTCFGDGVASATDCAQTAISSNTGNSTAGLFVKYAGQALVGQGFSPVLKSVLLVAQSGLINGTNLITTSASGAYRVSVYTVVSASGAVGTNIVISWNDGFATQSVNIPVGNALNAFNQSTIFMAVGSAQFITYSAAATTGVQYAARIVVERLV